MAVIYIGGTGDIDESTRFKLAALGCLISLHICGTQQIQHSQQHQNLSPNELSEPRPLMKEAYLQGLMKESGLWIVIVRLCW